MPKSLIVLITTSLSKKNKVLITKLENSIDENNNFLLISNNYFFFKKIDKYSNYIKFDKISDFSQNKEIVELVLLSIFEISILEIINKIKIFKNQNDFIKNKSFNLNFYSDKYPLKVIKNPIQYLSNINTNDIRGLEIFFKTKLNNASLVKTYKYFNLTLIKKNYRIYFEVNRLFFPKNINKSSLTYLKISSLYTIYENIFINLYSLIPSIVKEKARTILYNHQKKKMNQTNVYQSIFSKSFRRKLIFFKYFNILKK